MNNITICAKYKGDSTTERGLRTMLFEIPPTGGKQPVPVPISLIPSFASQDTCVAGRYTEGAYIVINGRLYPHEDGKLYVVPTQPLEELKKIGYSPVIENVTSQNGFNYKVIVGPFANRSQTNNARENLRRLNMDSLEIKSCIKLTDEST